MVTDPWLVLGSYAFEVCWKRTPVGHKRLDSTAVLFNLTMHGNRELESLDQISLGLQPSE